MEITFYIIGGIILAIILIIFILYLIARINILKTKIKENQSTISDKFEINEKVYFEDWNGTLKVGYYNGSIIKHNKLFHVIINEGRFINETSDEDVKNKEDMANILCSLHQKFIEIDEVRKVVEHTVKSSIKYDHYVVITNALSSYKDNTNKWEELALAHKEEIMNEPNSWLNINFGTD